MSKTQHSIPTIRAGIGGWLFEPWRGTFYPGNLAQSRELEYASRQLDVIEINSTYSRAQTPATFAKWRDATPEGFVFAVKAPMYATNRRVLADGGEIIAGFAGGGVVELGPKLGPIVWEFAPTKVFDPVDFSAFVKLVPRTVAGRPARHVLDVRHPSFKCDAFVALARDAGMAAAFTDADDPASFADVTADFVYARIKRASAKWASGFRPRDLDRLVERARLWADGGEPDDVPRVAAAPAERAEPRDVFMMIVSGDKEKAPAAAIALRKRLLRPGVNQPFVSRW